MIEMINISKDYVFRKQSIQVLKEVGFKISAADFTVLVGKSGSGKTTLLNIISGLTQASSGQIRIRDGLSADSARENLTKFRRDHMGFIFQHFNLIPYHTVIENVMIPLKFSSVPPRQHKSKAMEQLEYMGIADKANYFPGHLSGGQMQRVAIARSLIKDPKIILADEPTGNLDDRTAKDIIDLFFRLNEELAIAFFIATHDHEIINRSKLKYKLTDCELRSLD